MCAQVMPSGECLRGYKPRVADCSCLVPRFLPVLNPVVIPGLRAGTCCAVLHRSLYVCIILCNSVRLSCWTKKAITIIIIIINSASMDELGKEYAVGVDDSSLQGYTA